MCQKYFVDDLLDYRFRLDLDLDFIVVLVL